MKKTARPHTRKFTKAEDLAFAGHVEKSWKRYEQGKFVKQTREEFLEELRKA